MNMGRLPRIETLQVRRHMTIARYKGPYSIAHLLCTGTKYTKYELSENHK